MNMLPWKRKATWISLAGTVGIVAVGLIWNFSKARTGIPSEAKGAADLRPTRTNPFQVAPNPWAGYGWSTQEDSRAAVREAVGRAKAMLTNPSPVFAFVGSTADYDIESVRDELAKILDPAVKIHGVTSALGVMTPEGFQRGERGTLAVLLVASTKTQFGVCGVNLADFPGQKEAGRHAIQEAIRDAGVSGNQPPNLVLITPAKHTGGEMQILDGIAEVVGKDVPVVGGDAEDSTNRGQWREYTRTKVYQEGLIVTVLYSKAKVGWAFESGFRLTDKEGVVTRASGKIIQEIDHRPALDVYDEWLNHRLTEALTVMNSNELIVYCGQNPLCQVFRGQEGQIGYLTCHPIPERANLQNRFLPVATPIEPGSSVRLFTGTWQTVLNRAEYLPSKAMLQGELKPEETGWGLVIFCHGASRMIPREEVPKIPLLIRNGCPGVPFIGVITSGEQGPLPGIRNIHANLVESMVTVGK